MFRYVENDADEAEDVDEDEDEEDNRSGELRSLKWLLEFITIMFESSLGKCDVTAAVAIVW